MPPAMSFDTQSAGGSNAKKRLCYTEGMGSTSSLHSSVAAPCPARRCRTAQGFRTRVEVDVEARLVGGCRTESGWYIPHYTSAT